MKTGTYVRDTSKLVSRLGAAMHAARTILTKTKAEEISYLATSSALTVSEALLALEGVTYFPGHLEIRPRKYVSANVLYKMLINILSVNVLRNFSYFADQLARAKNDVNFLHEKQPRQRRLMRECASVLLSLEGHQSAILESHKKEIMAQLRRVMHRAPEYTASLGLYESQLNSWL